MRSATCGRIRTSAPRMGRSRPMSHRTAWSSSRWPSKRWTGACIRLGMADIVKTLNDLIASCRDSEEGFGKAAKGCHSDALRNRLIGVARQRADFADELAGHIRKLNGAPAATAHQSGVLH